MYRDEATREQVNRLIAQQQRLIRAWRQPDFDRDAHYAERLGKTVRSALELESYRELLGREGAASVDALLSRGADYRELLAALPILAKREYRAISGEASRSRRHRMLNYFETSGTTGEPLPAPKGLHDLVVNTVNFGEHWAEFLSGGDTALILINTPQGPAAFQFEHALNYLGIATFRTWVDTVRNDYGRVIRIAGFLRPTVFAGPPSQLINLYEYAAANGLEAPAFRKVLLTGERSSPALKRRLRQLTGGAVYDASYGSSETGTTAVAVSEDALRLQTHSYIFEIEERDGRIRFVTGDGLVEGELIVTALENDLRPLIRYRTGDLVRIEPREEGVLDITPLGRLGHALDLPGVGLDQDEFEELVWPEDGDSRIFNYFITVCPDKVYFVFTGDYDNEAQAERHLRHLREAIPGVAFCMVPKLPDIAGLGSTLGWKAARVHDLRKPADPSYPANIRQAMEQLRQFMETLRSQEAAV